VAAEMLRGAYQKGQQQKGQVKADMQTGKERAQDQAQSAMQETRARAEPVRRDGTGARPATG
jgi:hypothetical protein